jgi:hypothetical protein
MPRHSQLLALIILTFGFLSACAPVSPWQRGTLAKPSMALDPNPMQGSFTHHIYGSREAAAPSGSGSGGGCGCY